MRFSFESTQHVSYITGLKAILVMRRLLALVIFAVVTTPLLAQPIDSTGIGLTQAPLQTRDWSSIEVYLSIGVLLFALIVMFMQYRYLKQQGQSWTSESVIRFIGFPIVISAALFLVVAGYSDQQVAPVFALLGAIAGYLFGRSGEGSE